MNRIRNRAPTAPSLWDRFVFGVISAAAGALLGLGAAYVAALLLGTPPAYESIAWFSGIYFAVIGVIRGPDAGFFAGEVLRVVWAGAQAELGRPHPAERHEQREQPAAWRSVGLLLAWAAAVLLLAFR